MAVRTPRKVPTRISASIRSSSSKRSLTVMGKPCTPLSTMPSVARTASQPSCRGDPQSVTVPLYTNIERLCYNEKYAFLIQQYLRHLRGVDSVVDPPKCSPLGHHLINKKGIGHFRKQF